MDTYLETERLSLRPFTADDADLLIELDSDPAVMRYLSGGEPTPAQLVRDRDLPSVLAGYARWGGRFGLFGAYAKDGGQFVGWFLLRPEKDGPLDEVELGYRLRRAAWGRGYATEGALALLAKAFGELEVRTVWAETMTVNLGSRRVMEKAGMVFAEQGPVPEDMLMIEGAEQGGVRYEANAAEWARR